MGKERVPFPPMRATKSRPATKSRLTAPGQQGGAEGPCGRNAAVDAPVSFLLQLLQAADVPSCSRPKPRYPHRGDQSGTHAKRENHGFQHSEQGDHFPTIETWPGPRTGSAGGIGLILDGKSAVSSRKPQFFSKTLTGRGNRPNLKEERWLNPPPHFRSGRPQRKGPS